jgi:hypothetical protein
MMTWYVKLVPLTSILESGAVPSGWLWIVTRGAQVFQFPYFEVSLTTLKTRAAGAETLIEAESERVALPRGTMGVERLSGGHDSEDVMANAFRRREVEERLTCCQVKLSVQQNGFFWLFKNGWTFTYLLSLVVLWKVGEVVLKRNS